jgi:hypothetical protein
MESEQKDDVHQPDDAASEGDAVEESTGREPNEPLEVRNAENEEDDLTGRAYEYFHKLQ